LRRSLATARFSCYIYLRVYERQYEGEEHNETEAHDYHDQFRCHITISLLDISIDPFINRSMMTSTINTFSLAYFFHKI